MRLILKVLMVVVLLLLVGAAALVLMGTTDRPRVAQKPPPTAAEREWATDLLRSLKDGTVGPDGVQTVELTDDQAALLANMALERLGGGQLDVALGPGTAELYASVPAPWQPERWLNLRLLLRQGLAEPQVEQIRLGDLPLPAGLGQLALRRGLDELQQAVVLHRVDLLPGQAILDFSRERGSLAAVGAGLIGDDERRRLLTQQSRLAAVIAATPANRPLPMAELVSGLIGYQGPPPADSIAANRDALVVLAAYAVGRALPSLNGADGPAVSPARRDLRLRGRADLAKHFLTSAALAAKGGGSMADLVGLTKELNDADGGTGFSFIDMAANRSGIRFAALATGSDHSAVYLRRRARAGLDEDDLMPQVADLPEGMQRADFERAYRDADSPAYRAMVDDIDRRIDRLGLFSVTSGP